MQIASPGMKENAGRLWRNVDEWGDDVETNISSKVVSFIQEAKKEAQAK